MTFLLTQNYPMRLLLLAGLLLYSTTSLAIEFSSGPRPSMLIELYTSEGCSSCPPAEHYLNKLQQHEALWKQLFPIAFHVDYWNELGWVDRFSRPEYSQRQRDYARYLQRRTIYTPAFYINGSSWRPGWFNKPLPDLPDRNTGRLVIKVQHPTVTAHFTPVQASQNSLNLHLTILGMNLHTDIRSGENAGQQADHQFVVLHYQHKTSSNNSWQITLPKQNSFETRELAIVAWISEQGNPMPIQITGGMLQSAQTQLVTD